MSALARGQRVIGLAISAKAVRAVCLVAGQVSWRHEQPVDGEVSLVAILRTVLALAPRGRWGTTAISVGIGPAFAQLRRLHDLPAVRGERMLAAIVQQGAGRYFLQNGIPVVTTELTPAHDGDQWAGAIEEPVIAAVVDACRDPAFHLVRIGLTAATLGHAIPGGTIAWLDGDVMADVSFDGERLHECRRMPVIGAVIQSRSHDFDRPLQALGADALRFADAYAAARSVGERGLAIPAVILSGREPSRRRIALAGACCVAALVLALVSPLLAASRREDAATARLAAHAASSAREALVARRLADSARVLTELATFREGAPSTLLLLASLTGALDASVSLVVLRLDESGGTLTALTPSAAALLGMLEQVPEISAPAIEGSVTPELLVASPAAMGGTVVMPTRTAAPEIVANQQQRVVIRFHWKGERPATHSSRAEVAK